MIVKMSSIATDAEVAAIETKLHALGYKTGKMIGEQVTLIGVYGDISRLPQEELAEMPGVERLIPISRAYKRAAQKGDPLHPMRSTVAIGSVVAGGDDLTVVAGPCSVESEPQIMEAARIVREAEILDPADVSVYEDAGVACLQVGEPNSKNQALLNRLRETPLPIIHKRGNSLDTEAYLLWVERVMSAGKENVILCERGITSCNRYTRNTLDLGSVAAFHYQLSGLPVAVDASHGTGIRDLVFPLSLAGIMAGASVVLVEAHPNPLIAKSDGFQGLFPEQLRGLVKAAQEVWRVRKETDREYVSTLALERAYEARMQDDRRRFFPQG